MSRFLFSAVIFSSVLLSGLPFAGASECTESEAVQERIAQADQAVQQRDGSTMEGILALGEAGPWLP